MKIADERFKLNQEKINGLDVDTIFEQLKTEAGLAAIEYAMKVEDKVKRMNWLRKLLEKQRTKKRWTEKSVKNSSR